MAHAGGSTAVGLGVAHSTRRGGHSTALGLGVAHSTGGGHATALGVATT